MDVEQDGNGLASEEVRAVPSPQLPNLPADEGEGANGGGGAELVTATDEEYDESVLRSLCELDVRSTLSIQSLALTKERPVRDAVGVGTAETELCICQGDYSSHEPITTANEDNRKQAYS